MDEARLLLEQPAGPWDAPLVRRIFTIVGLLAMMAGTIQYMRTAQDSLTSGAPDGATGLLRLLEQIRSDLWLTWTLIVPGGLATYAGLTRMRLRSWPVLSAPLGALVIFVASLFAKPPKVDSSFLIAAVVYPSPVVIAVAWIALNRRKSLFR